VHHRSQPALYHLRRRSDEQTTDRVSDALMAILVAQDAKVSVQIHAR